MELKILDSILHGDLQPWRIDTTDRRKFTAWVKAASAASPATCEELLSQLAGLLSGFPALQQEAQILPAPKVKLQAPFYQVALPGYTDVTTQFYSLIIDRETLRVSNLLSQQVDDLVADLDKRYTVKKALNSVRVLATQTADTLRERGFTSFPDGSSELTHFVLFTLKQMLSALFFDMQERFKDLLPPAETEQSFCNNILQEPYSGTPQLKPASPFFEFQIQRIISENKFSEPDALDLLKQINQQQDAKLQTLQAALENMIFLHSQNTTIPSLAQLASQDFVAEHFSLAKQANTAQLQTLQYGHDRLEVANGLLDKLDFIQSSAPNKLSIPQLLHKWLSGQKEIYTARFAEKLPVITANEKPQKTNGKAAKLTFGFHGDTAKLKSVLSNLCNKIDLLNEEKNNTDELFALLTLKDIKPNSTQIHLGCETAQFRYIIDKLAQHFSNFTQKSIGESEVFYSKKGKQITAQNLYSSKIDNPKDKDAIDKILKQLQ